MISSAVRRPLRPLLGWSALVVTVPLVALAVLGADGSLEAVVSDGLPEPGVTTRLGLPAVQGLRDLASIVTVGCLVVAAFCVPPIVRQGRPEPGGAIKRLLATAAMASASWSLLNLLLVALVYSDASGSPMTRPGFATEALFFAQNYELGQYLLWGSGLAAAVALGCIVLTSYPLVGLLAAVSVAALWPMALTGHAAGTLNHDDAVNLQLFHLVAVSVWLGGLVALVITRRSLGTHLPSAAARFSVMATWCLVLVAVSGSISAALRVPSLDALASSFGALLAVKVTLLTAAGLLGLMQRRRFLAQISMGRERAFLKLVVVEVVVLSLSAGVGVALSRTPPPAGGAPTPLTPAESLTGQAVPQPLGAAEWFTQWRIDSLWLPVAALAVIWYLTALRRLRGRGDSWPVLRTVCWVLGWALLIWATSGAPGVYGRFLFSMHMVQHMTIATAVPTFLVLGAPVTLALRTTKRRTDDSYGPREWLLRLVHSLPAQLLGHPLVAAGMFIVSMVAFYYGSFFERSLESHTVHLVMVVHFLLSGYLFASCIIGADPGVERPAYPFRALLVMVTFGFHALFSVSLMASSTVLAEDWFRALGRDWGKSLSDDQYLGASLGWALGEYPLAFMAVALLVSWVRADQRERRRFDRSEDRNGRATASYNDYLARLGGGTSAADPGLDGSTTIKAGSHGESERP